MPQWRKLHVKITESQDVNDMPDDFTRFTWTLLPIALDSEGRAQDDASLIRSKLHPLRRDVTLEMIEAALCWYAERGMIFRYEVGGRHYFSVPTFKHYQGKTDREAASVIPEPTRRKRGPAPTTLPATVKSQSGPTQELVQTGSTLDVDVDSDAEEKRKDSAAPPPRPRDPVFDAIVEVCALDLTIQGVGGSVGKVATALKKASPPYSSEEILAWGKEQAWRSSPPTVWQLKQGVCTIRRKNGHSAVPIATSRLTYSPEEQERIKADLRRIKAEREARLANGNAT